MGFTKSFQAVEYILRMHSFCSLKHLDVIKPVDMCMENTIALPLCSHAANMGEQHIALSMICTAICASQCHIQYSITLLASVTVSNTASESVSKHTSLQVIYWSPRHSWHEAVLRSVNPAEVGMRTVWTLASLLYNCYTHVNLARTRYKG